MAILSIVEKLPKTTAQKECIDVLEQALAKAKNGEIVAVAIAMLLPSRAGATAFSETDDTLALIGISHYLVERIRESLK